MDPEESPLPIEEMMGRNRLRKESENYVQSALLFTEKW